MTSQGAVEPAGQPLVYTVAELQAVMKVSRRAAYRLANRIGIRVSPKRIVVPAARLARFLEGQE